MTDFLLQRFTDILCGTLDNQAQVDQEIANGKQLHPYAKHVTDICDHMIHNRPEGHPGSYILEESYYVYPGKEMELKPLFFYIRSDGISKVMLQSVQIPERFTKEEFTNSNSELSMDFSELQMRDFGVAMYEYHPDGYFTVDHEADMGGGLTFRLIETLSDNSLEVMELVHKDGIKLTPYETPILYKKI